MRFLRIILSIILYVVLLFATQAGYAQFTAPTDGNFDSLHHLAIKNYSINDGLPSKNTTCTIKDRNGFLWIGTQNGLCKFDGYQFKTFIKIPGDSSSLTNNYINVITEDKKGRIWVGTLDGLNLFDPLTGKFKRFYHRDQVPGSLSNNKIWALLADKNNNIWIGTDDGFNRFLEKEQRFEIFQPNSSNPNAIKGQSVNAIVEDQANNLWLGCWAGGLSKFDKGTKKFVNFPQPHVADEKNPNDIWSLCMAEDGNIWVGTYWKGLFKFDVSSKKFIAYAAPDKGRYSVFKILDIGNHLMVLGCNDNFYWFNSLDNRWQRIPELKSFDRGGLFLDENAIIWICSMEGLTKIDRQQYKFKFLPFKQEKRWIKSVLYKDHAAWLATDSGLTVVPLGHGVSHSFLHSYNRQSISNNAVNRLYLDSQHKLWDVTERGFDEYDERYGKFIRHTHHSGLGGLFNEDVFWDILEIKPGEYGLATDAGFKIYHRDSETFTHYFNQKRKPYSLSNNQVYCLAKDGNTIWMGTGGGGLNRFDCSSRRFYNYVANDNVRGSMSNNYVHQVFIDSRKDVWVCTQDGLNKYNRKSDSFQVYSKANGFASNVFKQMVEDKIGNLWIITETGLSCLNPRTMQIANFDEGDGILANAVICKTDMGQILLAGNKGLVFFDPLSIKYNKTPPPVYFSSLQIFNKPVEPNETAALRVPVQNAREIVLNYSQSVFSIEYVALNYTHTEKNRYAYMLEGFDQNWNYVGGQRKATYTNLSPGTYTFRVKASNNDGVWNKTGKSLTIVIRVPWYLSCWAYMIYALVAGAVVYGCIVYNNRHDRLQFEIRLTKIEAEKEKELHEKKLSYFTHISHEFRTPLTLIISPLEEILLHGGSPIDQQKLNTINRNARRLLSLVDQLLLFRKSEAGGDELKLAKINIVDLSREVSLCFRYQASRASIDFEYVCHDDDIEIIADQEKIEIVLFNLLSNAFKFTPSGGRIVMSVCRSADRVWIEVRDSGCGIPSRAGDKLYRKYYQEYQPDTSSKAGLGIGLYLVKNYTEQHGGEVSYDSKPGNGTVFKLDLPVGHGHFNPDTVKTDHLQRSVLFNELMEDRAVMESAPVPNVPAPGDTDITSDFKSMLIVEDNSEIRAYIKQVFIADHLVYEADNGLSGLKMVAELMPDIIISDVMMPGISGVELCTRIKEDPNLCHIPVILLTAITSPEIKLKGIEGGADDYISKPFEKDMLIARVKGLLKTRNNLQQYFFNEITLKPNDLKISQEYKEFLEKCISIVEQHLGDRDFSIKVLAAGVCMSHSNVYRKIKSISGQSANSFIRFIRLRKAAELFLTTDSTVAETAYKVGINDLKHFRQQFSKLFGLNPSEFIKKYRKPFHNDQRVKVSVFKKAERVLV
ncbi:hybrid sensor histidine kinase/response regulator transcription factor [Pedobacter hartonius]|uniref:histidine kinase n=1 Tax=Pedobacter hartonius TaxID=425514 RepID=A0A1H4GZL6_9SPHI|nr:two-component regulator propeller domain-containing protein [Pedobacter hartonius]SEB15025.1 Signal transduction histidine kinase [Pedobacter hartonius]